MKPDSCAHCGDEVGESGVEYKSRFFCSDECCEEYEDNLITNGEPDAKDLTEAGLEDVDFADIDFDDGEEIDEELESDYVEDGY